jgi:hypothetical protein
MMPVKKFSRAVGLLLAAVITIITGMIVANAVQTITTPNAAFVSYSLAAGLPGVGTVSGPITPAASRAVLVMGCCTTAGNRGVGQVALLRIPGAFVEWTGIESPAGAALTSGFDGGVGSHIVFLDFGHDVDIEVAGTDTIRIHNTSGAPQTGNVTLIW